MEHENEELIALPSIGFLIMNPLLFNTRIYCGFFFGTASKFEGKTGPFFHLRFFGGAEIFASAKRSFYIDFGGGGVFTKREIDYSQGALISGGTRFYF